MAPSAFRRVLALCLIGLTPFSLSFPQSPNRHQPYRLRIPLGLDEFSLQIPDDNRLSQDKVELGKLIFFDKRLSADGQVSCATCHDPQKAFSDGQQVSKGMNGRKGLRNAPTLINRLFGFTQFWDGRVERLEDQALAPMVNPVEMGNQSHNDLMRRVKRVAAYGPLFRQAFDVQEFTITHVAQALASFERTLLSGNSPFDRFESGGNAQALSEPARRGLKLFRGKARCHLCHTGFNLTDELFHNLGVGWRSGGKENDVGRYVVTKKNEDMGKFKTPTLREVTLTAPYMHDGSLATLEEVLDFYDRGGNKNPNLDPDMIPLKLTPIEKSDLLEFLKSLNGEGWQNIAPPKELIR